MERAPRACARRRLPTWNACRPSSWTLRCVRRAFSPRTACVTAFVKDSSSAPRKTSTTVAEEFSSRTTRFLRCDMRGAGVPLADVETWTMTSGAGAESARPDADESARVEEGVVQRDERLRRGRRDEGLLDALGREPEHGREVLEEDFRRAACEPCGARGARSRRRGAGRERRGPASRGGPPSRRPACARRS